MNALIFIDFVVKDCNSNHNTSTNPVNHNVEATKDSLDTAVLGTHSDLKTRFTIFSQEVYISAHEYPT